MQIRNILLLRNLLPFKSQSKFIQISLSIMLICVCAILSVYACYAFLIELTLNIGSIIALTLSL